MSAATAMRLTALDVAMLRQIATENVTFRQEYRRGGSITSYRLWSSENDYTIATRRVERLVRVKLAKEFHSTWAHGRGGVELTPEGKRELAQHPISGELMPGGDAPSLS